VVVSTLSASPGLFDNHAGIDSFLTGALDLKRFEAARHIVSPMSGDMGVKIAPGPH
jgi:hypothetical protein